MSFGAIALYLLVLEKQKHAVSMIALYIDHTSFPLVTNIIYQSRPLHTSGAPNENIVQNHLNIALLTYFSI